MFEIILFISFEILISMFAMLFELFPGTKYKLHKHVIQLYMSIAMMVLIVINALMVIIDNGSLEDITIFGTMDILKYIIILDAMVLAGSIYKYMDMKKNGEQIEIIELKQGQYHLEKPVETAGKHLYVKRLAICDGFTITFSTVNPTGEGNLRLVCKRIDDTNYECLTLEEDVDLLDITSFIAKAGSYLLYILYSLTALFIILVCHVTEDATLSTFYGDMLGSVFILAFGISIIKLFKGTKGCSKIFFLLFGAFVTFTATCKLLVTIVQFFI